jgi:hypothetical protein
MLVTLRLSLLDGRQKQLSREIPSAEATSEQIIRWIADRGRVSLGDRESCGVDEIRSVEIVPPPEPRTAPPWREPDQPADARQLRDEDVAAALRERKDSTVRQELSGRDRAGGPGRGR